MASLHVTYLLSIRFFRLTQTLHSLQQGSCQIVDLRSCFLQQFSQSVISRLILIRVYYSSESNHLKLRVIIYIKLGIEGNAAIH